MALRNMRHLMEPVASISEQLSFLAQQPVNADHSFTVANSTHLGKNSVPRRRDISR